MRDIPDAGFQTFSRAGVRAPAPDTDGSETLSDEARTSIEALRAQIDGIDDRIVELLNDRAKLALAIRALKPNAGMALYDPKREEEIFARLAGVNTGPLYADNVREIYAAILHVMKEL